VTLGLRIAQVGPVIMLVALVAVISALTPLFLTSRNITNLGFQSAPILALAFGQLLVILTRGIDISVGSIIGVVVAAGSLFYGHHMAGGLAVALMLGIGALVGVINGLLYVKGRMPHPFIVTLATYGIVRGVAFALTGGNITIGQPAVLETLAQGKLGPIPYATVLVAVLACLTWMLLKHLQWGRWIYAIGGNPDAAARVGIPVNRVLVSVYVLSGLAAGVAGIITAGQIGVGDANAGLLSELDAIAAVMIGGASFLGGRGSVSNAIVGALMVTVIRNGLNLLDVSGYWQQIAIGVVIAAAVELNVLRAHLESRFRVLQATHQAGAREVTA